MRAHETPRGWRRNKGKVCPACKIPNPENGWSWKFVSDGITQHNFCDHCGNWYGSPGRSDFLNAAKNFGPRKLEDLVARPSWMAEDEFAFRLGLCRTYLTRSFKSYLRDLEVFADMLGDRGSPEEAAARAEWRYRYATISGLESSAPDDHSPAYPSLVVRVADGWWETPATLHEPHTLASSARLVAKTRAQKRFGIPTGSTNQSHNGDWFLGWPPGWVKFTQPADEPKLWWVTVEPGRALTHSAPIEHKRKFGYAEFFHAPNAVGGHAGAIPGTV